MRTLPFLWVLLIGCPVQDDDSTPDDGTADDDTADDDTADDDTVGDDDSNPDDDSVPDDDSGADDDDSAGDDDSTPLPACDPDSLEPNPAAAPSALPEGDGSWSALTTRSDDEDWFTLHTCAGAVVELALGGPGVTGLVIDVWDADAAQLHSGVGPFAWNEGAAADLLLRVSAPDPVCHDYDLGLVYDDDLCCEQEASEPNDNLGSAIVLADGVTAWGGAVVPGDADWYQVPACEGGDLGVELTPTDPASPWDVALWGPSGPVDERTAAVGPQSFAVGALSAGTWSLRVAHPGVGSCQRYAVTATLDEVGCASSCLPDAHEPDDSPLLGPSSPVGFVVPTGTAVAGDPDYFPIELCPGAVVNATATYNAPGAMLDVAITDGLGVDLSGNLPSRDTATNWTAAAGGYYQVRTDVVAGGCFDYGLAVTVDTAACPVACWDDALEPNDGVGEGAVLQDLDILQGYRVTDTSPDAWGVPLCDGAVLTAVLNGYSDGAEADLTLLDDSGSPLAAITGADTTLAWTASGLMDTTLLVSAVGLGCGGYDMAVFVDDSLCPAACVDDGIEPNDDLATATELAALGDYPDMVVLSGSPDVFSVPLCAGAVLDMDLVSADSMTVSSTDSLGAPLGTAAAGPGGWTVDVTAAAVGTAYVTMDSSGPSCASYDLTWSVDESGCCAPDGHEPDNTQGLTTALSETTVLALTQGEGDPDWIEIDLCEGAELTVSATTDWPQANVDLSLVDSSGVPLTSAADMITVEELAWTATVASIVSLEISSAWGACSIVDLSITIDDAACPL